MRKPIIRLPQIDGNCQSVKKIYVNINTPHVQKNKIQHRSIQRKQPLKRGNTKLHLGSILQHRATLQQHKCIEQIKSKKNLIYKVFVETKAGCMIGGVQKVNQDNYIVQQYNGMDFYGICDGHGTNGHLVSRFLKSVIPKNMGQALKKQMQIQQAFKYSFIQTNNQLFQQSFDIFFSGSTLVTILADKKQLICGNVGDSRAIIIRQINNKYQALPLSIDQKPDYQPQKQRIIKAGGRIDNQRDQRGRPIGPLRVWLSKIRVPGLAMTRSFGDKAGTQAGMIASPVCMRHTITSQDCCMILASDGLWEFLQNQEVVQFISPFIQRNQLKKGCKALLNLAQESWSRNSTVRDDITIMIVKLRQ